MSLKSPYLNFVLYIFKNRNQVLKTKFFHFNNNMPLKERKFLSTTVLNVFLPSPFYMRPTYIVRLD